MKNVMSKSQTMKQTVNQKVNQAVNKSQAIKNLVLAAIFASMTTLLTMFLHIHIGNGGYVHLGDAVIFLSASLLPLPYAVASAGIGGALSDLFLFPAYALPTLLVKALLALAFSSKKAKIICLRNILALPVCAVITIGGYYLAESILYGNWVAPVASIPSNLIQAAGSSAVYIILGMALDKMKIKRML